MSRIPRLVERFAVGAFVEVEVTTPAGGVWVPGRVVAHDHPAVWVEAAGARLFVTNGNRIRERAARREPLFKIATAAEWSETERNGVYPGSPADRRDGFVHLSDRSQVRETAARHFAGQDGLLLLDVDPASLDPGTLRWESSRGGALFPHIHGKLRRAAVARARPLPLGADGLHEFPADL